MKKRHLIGVFAALLILLPLLAGCGGNLKTTISKESGEYYGEQEISLSNSGKGVIYYTLDGSDPQEKGNEYDPDKPLHVNFDSTLKAYTKDGGSKGPVVEATYTIKSLEQKDLPSEALMFSAYIKGTYQSGDSKIVFNGDRSLSWQDASGSGESKYMITMSADKDPLKATLAYVNPEGKEQKYEIDANQIWNDGSLSINGTVYQPVEEAE